MPRRRMMRADFRYERRIFIVERRIRSLSCGYDGEAPGRPGPARRFRSQRAAARGAVCGALPTAVGVFSGGAFKGSTGFARARGAAAAPRSCSCGGDLHFLKKPFKRICGF